MKRAAFVAVLAIFLLGAVQVPELARPSEANALGVRVTINPASEEEYQLLRRRVPPGSYVARASIYNAADERVLGSSEVILAAGANQTSTTTTAGLTVTFTVGLSQDNTRAGTKVTAKRGEQIVLQQQSDVVLRAPERAFGR